MGEIYNLETLTGEINKLKLHESHDVLESLVSTNISSRPLHSSPDQLASKITELPPVKERIRSVFSGTMKLAQKPSLWEVGGANFRSN
ncbi:hypothetical protein V6N13_037497 [Hibiscus sabdariffa]